jgi:Chaperone for flagella basal body P-ring formation
MRYKLIKFCLLSILAFAAVANANERTGAATVTPQQISIAIRQALRGSRLQGLTFADDTVAVSSVPAKSNLPDLQVVRITVDPKTNTLSARLRCPHRACLPFYATVEDVKGVELLSRESLLLSTVLPHSRRVSPSRPKLVHAGQIAKMAIASPGIRISMEVICLQSGIAGDSVRVRDIRTGKVFLAQVDSAGALTRNGGSQ